MKKILIIQNKRIGDVLLSTIIADNFKLLYPNTEVHFFAYDYTIGVLEHHKNIDEIISVNEKSLKKIPNLLKMAFKIKSENYNVIFDPYAKFQSRVICYISSAKLRIGYRKKNKNPLLKVYTHNIDFLKEKTKPCGKSIEDRINLVSSVFQLDHPIYEPKIYLTAKEKQYPKLESYHKPVLVFGIFGSNPKKSMPSEYIVDLINHVTGKFDVQILFNYAPYQKEDALKVYEACEHKDSIIFDIYEENIRGFARLMNASHLLIANEGGAVHIAKALNKPTFTIYSPYILRESWASFEDGKTHTSVHLLDHKPDLFSTDRETRKKIEDNPRYLYEEFTPDLILPELNNFLKFHLS